MKIRNSNNGTLKTIMHMGLYGVVTATAVAVIYKNRKSISKVLNQFRGTTKSVGKEVKEYAYEQKDEFVREIRDQLNELNQEVEKISTLIETSADKLKTKTNYKPKLDKLNGQIAKMHQRLDDAKNSTESTWNQIQEDSKETFESVKESVKAAGQWVDKKVHSA